MELKSACDKCGSMTQEQMREVKQNGCEVKWGLLCECCQKTIMGKMIIYENHMFCSEKCVIYWRKH